IYSFKRTYANLNYQFSGDIDSPGELKETYILIIGESARKASMSLYGYHRDTNPILQNFMATYRQNIIPYTNAISVSPFTRASVPVMLSVTDAKSIKALKYRPSIIKIFNAVGYKTFLISNQPRRGFHHDVISTMMKDVASSIYLEDVGSVDKTYDAAVIPFLERCLKDTSNKKLIVIHLIGSHYNYKERYPPNHSFFEGESLVTTYNNSIRYTDLVLGEIAKVVLNSDQAIAVLYVSDHGENLNDNNDNNFGHGRNDFTQYELEIPFIFIFNSAFIETKTSKVEKLIKRKNYAVSHDHVSHTLLGLAGIYDDQVYKESKDLASPFLFEQGRYVIDRDDMNIFLVNLYKGRILKTLSVK
ncbi:MAG: phosphoethanolamine transferase, partial [Bacteroidetes bacterium]|nr:phosphoethanolamine transferase [Bacteroidota bacterium]